MKNSGFKLKSGNKPLFKLMGGSPVTLQGWKGGMYNVDNMPKPMPGDPGSPTIGTGSGFGQGPGSDASAVPQKDSPTKLGRSKLIYHLSKMKPKPIPKPKPKNIKTKTPQKKGSPAKLGFLKTLIKKFAKKAVKKAPPKTKPPKNIKTKPPVLHPQTGKVVTPGSLHHQRIMAEKMARTAKRFGLNK